MSDDPKLNEKVTVLSLDQCFLSILALNRQNDTRISALKTQILKAVGDHKLVCPAHFEETVFESTLLPKSEREKVLSFQNQVSYGLAFRSFTQLLGFETLSLVRPKFQFEPYTYRPILVQTTADLTKMALELREAKTETTEAANQMPYPPKSYDPKHGLFEIFRNVSTERSASMCRIATAILESRTYQTGQTEWEFAQAVGKFLLENRITSLECHNLIQMILHHEWETMCPLGYHTLLCAKVEEDMVKTNKRYKSNDYIDLLRLAVALQYADGVACDTPMKELVRQTKLEGGRAFFSMRELDKLLRWVESI